MKKYTLILVLTIVLTACATTKNGNTKSLKLTEAVSQAFVLGMQRSDGKSAGNTYSMYFQSKADLSIEKLWIKGTNIDFERVETDKDGGFRLRSTFYNVFKNNLHTDIKEPIEHSGEGLVQYKENNETKYLVIESFNRQSKTVGK